MNKKIELLALGAVTTLALALPTTASAQMPLHLTPQPVGGKNIDGVGGATLSTTSGTTIICNGLSGTATFSSPTIGTMELTFGPHCKESASNTTCTSNNPPASSGTVKTTQLNFDLVTLAGQSPGILLTPGFGGSFAHFTCLGGIISFTVEAHIGVLGTITGPACGSSSNQVTLRFERTSHGVQKHQALVGTSSFYSLKKGGETLALDAHGTITVDPSTLGCT